MKPEIIAEIGVNHGGNMEVAKMLILKAKQAGADVAKFQLWNANNLWPKDFKYYEYVKKCQLSFDNTKLLKSYCDSVGIEFLASVFDVEKVKWCEELGVKRYKLASRIFKGEEKDWNWNVIEVVDKTGKITICSNGLYEDWPDPIRWYLESRTDLSIISLYCISKYPTSLKDISMESIDFDEDYNGYSDHTVGIEACMVALARGAQIVEKHFTLNRKEYGPDHMLSADYEDLKGLGDFRDKVIEIL